MTKTKYDDTWLLAQAREIFEVIGDPGVVLDNGFFVYLKYIACRDKWFLCEKGKPFGIDGGYRHKYEAARFSRDYLREKLEEKEIWMSLIGNGKRVAHKPMDFGGGIIIETLTKDGEWLDIEPEDERVAEFDSINEAIIKAARVAFLGGK